MKDTIVAPVDKALEQRLDSVLQAWQGLEPRPDFEQRVWRGIRSGAAAPQRGGAGVFWLQSHSAWIGALAASLAITVGIVAGLRTAVESTPRAELRSVMHGRTLAASYLTLVSGATR